MVKRVFVIVFFAFRFAVPDIPYSLPASVTIQNLNTLLNTLLKENEVTNTDFEFDFLISGEFLKTSAGMYLFIINYK